MASLFIATSNMQRWKGLAANQDMLTTVYIGKSRAHDNQFNQVEHSLTNPYTLGTGRRRVEALEKYRKRLWNQINDSGSPAYVALMRVVELAREGPIVLVCTYATLWHAAHRYLKLLLSGGYRRKIVKAREESWVH